MTFKLGMQHRVLECYQVCLDDDLFYGKIKFDSLAFYIGIKALQALHDTPPLCLFLLLHMFWHKNINVSTRFDQIHQSFHKTLSINIILKSVKGHNSVEKLVHKILSINEISTSIKDHNSVENERKILFNHPNLLVNINA